MDATERTNTFIWSAANPFQFIVDGFQFAVAASTNLIVFRGAAGYDRIQLTGSQGTDHLTFNDDRLNFVTPGMQIKTQSIEDLLVDASAGQDTAILNGTAGDDRFDLAPDAVTVATPNWEHAGQRFQIRDGPGRSGSR